MAEYDKSLEHDSYFDCDENIPKSKLIGKYAYITDGNSVHHQDWGEVVDFKKGLYYIVMDTDKETVVTFNRDQFKVPERQWLRHHADEIKHRNAIV